MNIVLLSPAGAMHRYNGMFHKNLHYAPITLALLAALVPKDIDCNIKIYDETAEPIPLDLKADLIAITCITGTCERSYKYADYFRSKGITIVLGGVHPTILPQEAKKHADSVMVGLGDKTFSEMIYDFVNNRLKEYYYGNKCVDISGRPLPRKDLLLRKKYITLNTVEAVRGCNFNCSFCIYPAAFGKRVITRPIKDVIAEIKTFKGKIVIFPDVNLFANMDYAKQLLNELKKLHKWWFGLSTSAIGDNVELIRLCKESGCKGLLIGFESVNQDTQVNINKNVNNVDKYETLMENLHKNKIMIMGCFALGGDNDKLDVFDRTVELCERIKIDLPRFSIITPFPNTKFYEDLQKSNRITKKNWALYDVEHVVFEPKNMSETKLIEGMADAWRKCYSWKSIFKRFDYKRMFSNILIYLLVNIGYRKYALNYKNYGDDIMIDNSDIPEV